METDGGSGCCGKRSRGAVYDVKLPGLHVDFYLRANGASLYTVNNTHPAIAALKTGDSLTDRFQHKVRNSVAGMEDWAPATVIIQSFNVAKSNGIKILATDKSYLGLASEIVR